MEVFESLNGEKPKLVAIHAGLECGLFKEKMPNLDIIAVGCNMEGAHTPEEKLDLASFERTFTFVKTLLKKLIV